MGREALIHAEVGNEAGEAKALLESNELILRGEIKRRYPKGDMEGLQVEGEALCFSVRGEMVRLVLGETVAASWLAAIRKPPPSLRAKLGLDNGARAALIGAFDDALLAAALEGVLVDEGDSADLLVAIIAEDADLDRALAAQRLIPQSPIWMIYPKGKAATPGDTAIRARMRAEGFRDTKSCAVSERLTATRYNPL